MQLSESKQKKTTRIKYPILNKVCFYALIPGRTLFPKLTLELETIKKEKACEKSFPNNPSDGSATVCQSRQGASAASDWTNSGEVCQLTLSDSTNVSRQHVTTCHNDDKSL